MILSMTGYGDAQYDYKGNAVKIELRSLNGKTIDARLRLPLKYKKSELELRKLMLSKLLRGKIDCTVTISDLNNSTSKLNLPLISQYIKDLKQLQEEEDLNNADILTAVFSIPNIHDHQDEVAEEEELILLFEALNRAIDSITEYRVTEGKSLLVDMDNRINAILEEHEKVNALIEDRNKTIVDRIRQNLNQIVGVNIDENRFEQEIIYYLDKLDINEEQVRLEQNCKYFLEILHANTQEVKGKKLGFIAQEIGREINTLGSKAQHSDIQRLVVLMKDDLEKLKEQLANVL